MVKILIVTHGSLGKALIETASLIFGKTDNVSSLGLYHGDSVDDLKKDIKNFVQGNDTGEGILFLTDLLGGSPCNNIALVMKEMNDRKLECIVGVNLPMLLSAISEQKDACIKDIAHHCKEQGCQNIYDLREKFEF